MGLGITRASLVSAVCDGTGDDSTDAVVKVRRLINEKGREFCDLAQFPFLNSDLSFSITSAAYKYSGASYLPTTFKRMKAGFLLDGTTRCPLTEVSVDQAYLWENPDDNDGRPNEFCITRPESGYWEIQFNRTPDATYVVYFEMELQWTDLTADSDETVVTNRYYPQLAHFVKMARFIQQGDTENYAIAKNEWSNPDGTGMLQKLIASLINPKQRKSVIFDRELAGLDVPVIGKSDYNRGDA